MGKHRKPVKAAKHENSNGVQSKEKPGKQPKSASNLLVQPRPDWHAAALPSIDVQVSGEVVVPPAHLLDRVQQHASSLLDAETARYASGHLQSSSSHKFYSTIMSSGTWGDKVSALTLVVQESPLHTQKYFDNLLGLAGKKTRSQALVALGAIKDMMAQGVLLPSDRKLRLFTKQPALLVALQGVKPSWTAQDALPSGVTDAHLIVWAYEDWLKKKYFEVLRIIESWCTDEVEFSRLRAVQYVWELLKDKPEQEENLLRLLVNKLGDTSKKVASKASHLLLQMQNTHPSMKTVITTAIETEILLRPGQNAHAKYYAIITLNQTILSAGDPELANKLLDIYFSLFVSLLNKSRIAKTSPDQSNGKKRKRPGPQQPTSEDDNKADQQLEEKIIAQVLTGINRAFPYSKGDSATFEKHLDTMFRICHSSNFNTSIQALMLIQQISTSHHITTDRFMRTLYESLLDPRLLKSSKQTMYLNLLYRSLKSDGSIRRVKAFVKRLLQILSLHEPPFVTAALFLILDLVNTFPGLESMLSQPELAAEDEDEVFKDVPEDGVSQSQDQVANTITPRSNAYDPRKRDPLHAHADTTPAWELPPYLVHYHPSVAVFTASLLAAVKSKDAPAKPDPATHTLMHFLDRFVYRNPKATPASGVATRGTSLMQPALANTGTADTLFRPGASNRDAGASLNSASFWERKAADVDADEVFFHKYFGELAPKRRAALEKKAKKQSAEDVDDMDEDWDEGVGAGEDEIWKALVGSRPELEGADDMDDEGSGFEDEDGDVDADFAEAMGSDGDDAADFDDIEFSGSEGDIDVPELDDDDISVASEDEAEDDESDGMEGVEFNMESDVDSDDEGVAIPPPKKVKSHTESVTEEVVEEADDKKKERDEKKKKKRKIKSLPMFADVGEYAKMLENESDGEGNDDGNDWKQ